MVPFGQPNTPIQDPTPSVVATTVARAGEIQADTPAVTPGAQPNVQVVAISPFVAVLTRAARTYLQVFLGLLLAAGAGATTNLVPVGDFLSVLRVSAMVAIAPSLVSLLQNSIELLAKLDQSAPSLRA